MWPYSCCFMECCFQDLHDSTQMTCGTVLEKQGQTHKRHSLMDSCTWMCHYWSTSKDLHQLCMDTGCSVENLSRAMDDWDGWRESERVKELHVTSVT